MYQSMKHKVNNYLYLKRNIAFIQSKKKLPHLIEVAFFCFTIILSLKTKVKALKSIALFLATNTLITTIKRAKII